VSVAIRFVLAGALLAAASAVWKAYVPAAARSASGSAAVSNRRPLIAAGVQEIQPRPADPPPPRALVNVPQAPAAHLEKAITPPVSVARPEERVGMESPLARHPSSSSSRPALVAGAGSKPTTAAQPNELDLAMYYHRAGDFENALQHYREVLRADELNGQAHNNLGLLYQERNLLEESARELQRALAIEPGNAGTHNNFGVTLLKQGRVDEALGQFDAASRLSPRNVDALVNAALARRDANQPGLATETLLRALAIEPRNAAAHYNLAQLYDRANETAAAVDHYRKFLECAGTEYASRAGAVRTRIEVLSRHSN
jgi:Tfp pilus assembly protein PilF